MRSVPYDLNQSKSSSSANAQASAAVEDPNTV